MCNHTEEKEKLLAAAQTEFMAHGFREASLTEILKQAGMTETEFHAFYPDKASLFDALVSDAAEGLMTMFRSAQDAHFDLIPSGRKADDPEMASRTMMNFVDYIYDHYSAFQLIIMKSAGTRYEHYIQEIVNLDVTRTEEFYAELRRTGRSSAGISYSLHRATSKAYFTSVFDTVADYMSKEDAVRYVTELSDFFRYGWEGINGGSAAKEKSRRMVSC